ncbi:MAG: LysE family transporter, partial [Verrucomicrobiota bacterium]|nr:LysE family transporter [Verrucomicrobiota bacterium]
AMTSILFNGLLLGWSVAWPPGPVNAEMIRRGVQPKSAGGGFWAAWRVGLGACTGDFIWALSVSAGAGAIMNTPRVRMILGVISLVLLLFLAVTFSIGAWRAARKQEKREAFEAKERRRLPGYFLGFSFALTSPWNIGFWLAVIGSQSDKLSGTFLSSVFLAVAVVCGALTWGFVLAFAVKLGARIFSRPAWQVVTQALTALVMLYFAFQLLRSLALTIR